MMQNMSIVLTASNPQRRLDHTEYNDLVQKEIAEYMAIYDLEEDDQAPLIALLQNCGVEFDACSICGAMPMNTNCNNAGCDV